MFINVHCVCNSIIRFLITNVETLVIVIHLVWGYIHWMVTVSSVVPLAVLPMSEML